MRKLLVLLLLFFAANQKNELYRAEQTRTQNATMAVSSKKTTIVRALAKIFALCGALTSVLLYTTGCAVQLSPKAAALAHAGRLSLSSPPTTSQNAASGTSGQTVPSFPSPLSIWTSALTAIVVAGIGGFAAFRTATAVADRNARSQKDIEAEKREYVARGQRSKLTFLLITASNAIVDALEHPSAESKRLKAAELALSDFARLPDTPSAFNSDRQVNAIYDIVLALEKASLDAASFRFKSDEDRQEAINNYEHPPDEEWWGIADTLAISRMYLHPLSLISEYFQNYRSEKYSENVKSQQTNLVAAIERIEDEVRRIDKKRAERKARRDAEDKALAAEAESLAAKAKSLPPDPF